MSNTNVKASTQYAAPVHRHTPSMSYELVSFDTSKENPISFEDVNLNVINTLIYLDKTRVCTHNNNNNNNDNTPEPYIRATVMYMYNRKALHCLPPSTSTNFTLQDFQKRHGDWLEYVTEYSIDDVGYTSSCTLSQLNSAIHMDNVDEILANALVLTSDILESSWKPADSKHKYGAYQLTKYEAAETAALKMGIPESFVQLIDILLSVAWNDSLSWANRVLNPSNNSETMQENDNVNWRYPYG